MKILSLCVTIFAMASTTASAAIVVNIGNHVLLANTPNQIVPILVSGDEPVAGLNFNLQVDPSGLLAPPMITGLDIIGPGTIFNASNTGQTGTVTGELDPVNLPDVQFALASTTTASGTLSPNGTLGFVTFDTTGVAGGNFILNMDSTLNGPTDFGGTPVTSFSGGNLSITAVPEPSSIILLSGIAGVLGWRRRRASLKKVLLSRTEVSY